MPPTATKAKPLHPHRAIWIVAIMAAIGGLSYGTYLWQAMMSAPAVQEPSDQAPVGLTPAQSQAVLDSLRATSTATTTGVKAPPVDNAKLNSMKAKGSSSSSGQVNNSVLDSLKSH